VVDDLCSPSRSASGKRAGLEAEFVRSEKDVIDKATNEKPMLIILDSQQFRGSPLELMEVKNDRICATSA